MHRLSLATRNIVCHDYLAISCRFNKTMSYVRNYPQVKEVDRFQIRSTVFYNEK